MTYQISFSGGMGSAVTALVAYENGLDFNLIFADTLIEDEDLYRFNKDIARACGKEIVHLTDGRTPWDVYVDKRWIGNSRTAHCSTELKTKPVMAWLENNSKDSDPLVLGMDWSEQDRIDRAAANWAPRPVVSLLNRYKVTRPMFEPMLAKYGIRKPRLYAEGYEHNNCGGFCCKAGLVQFERLYRTNPKRFDYHEKEMERALSEIGPTAKPFLRKTMSWSDTPESVKQEIMRLQHEQNEAGVDEDGALLADNRQKISSLKIRYISLKELREELDRGTMELPMFDAAGCGCFTDEDV